MIPSHPSFTNYEVIGRGSSATVYKATYTPTNMQVSLKSVFNTNDPEIREETMQEINIHRSLDHPFIVSYYGSYEANDQTVIVMEFVKCMSLLDSVNQTGSLQEFDAQRIFCQLVSAVKYLHVVKKVAHRDLKLENILITYQRNIKLIDFGFAHVNVNVLKTQCASIPYAAPEIFKGEEYTESVDIWSLGVILYAMLTGELPFGDGDIVSIASKVLGGPPKYPDTLSESSRDLISKMLEIDQTKRLNIEQVEMHPWTQMTRFALLIKQDIICPPEILVNPTTDFDQSVIRTMERVGVNTSGMTLENFNEKDTETSMSYRIIKKCLMFPVYQKVLQAAVFPKQTVNSAMVMPQKVSRLPNIYSPGENKNLLQDSQNLQTASMFLPAPILQKPTGKKVNLPLKNKAKVMFGSSDAGLLFNSLGIKTRMKSMPNGGEDNDLLQTVTRSNYTLPSISMFSGLKKT
ncbi:CAMK family protein kinase [Tritrichomonas foetus]|uniref:CAMK family protein kinase n=1 Tax=Tritrichomonas foetus TaxID=1144522 RepID=A0A1J4KZM6_9EUKA|nr:CAMK family protein kinase [Tritrichomonas foetus]|eukprot:OHT15045.1 CAMK family protein kinase [Tritrichomonas foetus]